MPAKNGRKYDWGEWFKLAAEKGRFECRRGVHYQCAQTTMVQNARNAAVRLGYKVSVHDLETSVEIKVRSAPAKGAK